MTNPTYPGGSTYPGPNTYPGTSAAAPALATSTTNTVSVTQTYRALLPLTVTSNNTITVSQSYSASLAGKLSATTSNSVNVNQAYTANLAVYTNPTITASVDPTNRPPRVLLQTYNIGGPTAKIVRVNPDGSTSPVRTGDPATISSGSWVGYDYEAPFNVPVSYRATPGNGSAVVMSPTVTLRSAQAWMVHPGVPDLSCSLIVGPMGDDVLTASAGVFDVLSRADPIVITDGRRKSATSTLEWSTLTADQELAMQQLLYDNSPVLLQVVDPSTDESQYRWIMLGDVTCSREGGVFGEHYRAWSAPYNVVGRPAGALQAQRTYADLVTEAATYDALAALYPTYRGVLTGIAGT